MNDEGRPVVGEDDLRRWSEALAGIARTGLAFTDNQYEQERFEEVLHVAADMAA
ncbi:MAG: NUDIX hydrolase N-terminal domain-containing protein, partial [bacterium]|nr:NUDIX hydrolase N-terminal domain-containing protein [bacterium]